ncbi:MAG: phosphate acyltransferase PlsX [Oscillospiraceae bacterium]|nr:phosphate acyltransferase PlsX [Oscillospiraceae bacterium]
MKIIVDAMGGDNAPLEILKGCALAHKEYDVQFILVGNEQAINDVISKEQLELGEYEIIHTDEVVSMEDEPTCVIKDKKESSLGKAFTLLRQGYGDAVVSAGSTGAVLVGATMTVGRIRGIKRPALATVLPGETGPSMLLDCGANVECRPEMLLQFALMGSIYMNKIQGVDKPRVMLANVGTEDSKGGPLQKETFELLKGSELNFCGNIEGRDILAGIADVVVADGFSGNLILKTCEGVAGMMYANLKQVFKKNFISKLAATMVMSGLKVFKKKMDYTEYGGAPLMGIAKPVIKAHGSSNAVAFKNALRQAMEYYNNNVIETIQTSIAALKEGEKNEGI